MVPPKPAETGAQVSVGLFTWAGGALQAGGTGREQNALNGLTKRPHRPYRKAEANESVQQIPTSHSIETDSQTNLPQLVSQGVLDARAQA